ncbi:MAG: hypothetical protein HYZ23_06760 [Chloroflexi bacterium]|nr:hypothetical protein [Chloroflexota bacterium]
MLKRNQRMLAIFLAFGLLLACAPLATPVAPPTFDMLSIDTSIAQTAGAAATQTFVLLPTSTVTPTITVLPTETPTETPTFIFILATPTVPSATPTFSQSDEPYACAIVDQNPANETGFVPGIAFQTRWRVRNIGTQTWGVNTADYRYSSGTKFHKVGIYDFPSSARPGDEIDIFVQMWAPMDPGEYSTTWKLKVGKTEFCSMKLKIIVKS